MMQMMMKAFPSIVDVNFTATLEDLLDKVGDGTIDWKVVVRNFYPDLEEAVKVAEKELSRLEENWREITFDEISLNKFCEEVYHALEISIDMISIEELQSGVQVLDLAVQDSQEHCI